MAGWVPWIPSDDERNGQHRLKASPTGDWRATLNVRLGNILALIAVLNPSYEHRKAERILTVTPSAEQDRFHKLFGVPLGHENRLDYWPAHTTQHSPPLL